MLKYFSLGPTTSGNFAAAYETPGCDTPTIACLCSTEEQSISESTRLNDLQRQQEAAIQHERALCGFRISDDLGGV